MNLSHPVRRTRRAVSGRPVASLGLALLLVAGCGVTPSAPPPGTTPAATVPGTLPGTVPSSGTAADTSTTTLDTSAGPATDTGAASSGTPTGSATPGTTPVDTEDTVVDPPTDTSGSPPVTDPVAPLPCGGGPCATNVLVIIADDLGVEKLGMYGLGVADTPPTPNLDALADEGVRFERAYSQPVCSPTRASVLTGRLPWRTGVGWAIAPADSGELQFTETTLPEAFDTLSGGGWYSAMIGKWHLGNNVVGMIDNALDHGFDSFSGTLGNLYQKFAVDNNAQGYFDWELTTNGVVARQSDYNTTVLADQAIAEIATAQEPWFVLLSFNAAHDPFHNPPSNLTDGIDVGPDAQTIKYNAMIEAMDTEIGRVLDSMDPALRARTVVVFMADNGTPFDVADGVPSDRVKDTVYEGGVRVPLIVAGPVVADPGRTVDALVQAVDLFPTVLDVAGLDPIGLALELDGVSFAPLLYDPLAPATRAVVSSEAFEPGGFGPTTKWLRMVRDDRWKIIQRQGGADEFYDMSGVDYEGTDLMTGALTVDQQAAYDALVAATPFPLPP